MKTATAPTKDLVITSQQGVPLSKKQVQFNKLTNRIERLRNDIAAQGERNDVLMKAVDKYLTTASESVARAELGLAYALEVGALENKFSKPQKAKIGSCIVDFCSRAFKKIIPTDEEKALYDRWSDYSYDEEVKWQVEEEKDLMESMLEDMLGVEVDLDELRDNPEKMAELQEEFERKMKEEEFSNNNGNRKTKAQTKAQASKEAKQKAAEELKSKSVRSIYISLAKLIHPDKETDPLQREAKEEEMKKLSAAYKKNDLTTLLAMEMDWIHKQNDHLKSISEDKLALYVEVLKDQVRELEQEKVGYSLNPRYEMIREYTHLKKETGLRRIKKSARELNQAVLDINREARSFEGAGAKKKILEFATAYVEAMEMMYWY
jgi:hypothetical protein